MGGAGHSRSGEGGAQLGGSGTRRSRRGAHSISSSSSESSDSEEEESESESLPKPSELKKPMVSVWRGRWAAKVCATGFAPRDQEPALSGMRSQNEECNEKE